MSDGDAKEKLPTFLKQHALKILGALLTAVVTAALAFTTNAASAALGYVFNKPFDQCELKWVPIDCPGGSDDPSIGICGCEDRRSLGWFKKQLEAFKTANIPPFNGMPASMHPVAAGAGYNLLVLSDDNQDTATIWRFGIGYNAKSREKDWCLRLYRATKNQLILQSPVLCLDRSGSWWKKPSEEAPNSSLAKTSATLPSP